MEYTAEQKLKILSDWLQDSDDGIDPYYDGQLERAIKIAKKEVKQEIGNYLEEILNEYADPKIWPHIAESVKKMQRDIKNGDFHLDPKKAYAHNDMIHAAFKKAKEKAWASIRNHPEVIRLLEKKEQQLIDDRTSKKETSLSSYKKKQEKINKLLNRKNK